MATYKLIGQRFLRKYSASRSTPVYAASTDAQLIVSSLCDVPWTKVAARDATMTYHTEENVGSEDDPVTGLDMNVLIRDEFDAALFCAGHSGGQHRAYANAAVYRYALPDEAVGVSLSSLKLSVTSDPYNSNGARIHVMTNSTGVIPTNCHSCRGEDSSGTIVQDGTTASRVAVRTSQTSSGKTYWYPTNAACTIAPTGGLALQKYLFVFVLMESYSTVRGNWIEGCSFIENRVELTTATDVSGWTDGDTVDLTDADAGSSFRILSGGVLPQIPSGAFDGIRACEVRTDGNLVIEEDGSQFQVSAASGNAAAQALSRLYARFDAGDGFCRKDGGSRPGAAFNVTRRSEDHAADGSSLPAATEVVRIDASALVVPFAAPRTFDPVSLRLSFASVDLSPGASFNVFLASDYRLALSEDTLKDKSLFSDSGDVSGLVRLGSFSSGTSAVFSIPSGRLSSGCGTVVVTGSFAPECYNLATGGTQGTGAAIIPDITLED